MELKASCKISHSVSRKIIEVYSWITDIVNVLNKYFFQIMVFLYIYDISLSSTCFEN
jgi:hypothetical protein